MYLFGQICIYLTRDNTFKNTQNLIENINFLKNERKANMYIKYNKPQLANPLNSNCTVGTYNCNFLNFSNKNYCLLSVNISLVSISFSQ